MCFGYDMPPAVKVFPHGPTVFSLSSVSEAHDLVAYPIPKVSEERVIALETLLRLANKTVKLKTFEALG